MVQGQIIKSGIEAPFLAFPPGSQSGSLAKADSSPFSDAEIQSLNDTKMEFGGVVTVWDRMPGQPYLVPDSGHQLMCKRGRPAIILAQTSKLSG